MTLYAWVGEDEHGGGVVGLKQAIVPAGIIPLVCIEQDKHKITAPYVVQQMQAQATAYGVTIRLVAFTDEGTGPPVITLVPQATSRRAE